MTAAPINDTTSPTLAATMASVNDLPPGDVAMVMAACMGRINDKLGRERLCRSVGSVLSRLYRPTERKSLMLITAEVAARHGVSVQEMLEPDNGTTTKTPRLVRARHEAWWEARLQRAADGRPRFSYPMIGRFYGGRDHTTVMHGVRRHEKRLLEAMQ